MSTPISPTEFMSAAPKSVSGSSPWAARYAIELRRVFLDHAARAPRTLQQHLGPSELGVECDRQVVGKMAALPTTNHVADPWPSIRGTALHAWAADAFTEDNERRGLLRWVAENPVVPHPDHPGTSDLYDAVEQSVDDHKFLGESSMAKIRKGWPRKYLVQLLLYGLGYLNLGLPVRRVVVAAYPATAASLDGLYVRDHEFTSDGYTLLPENVDLLELVFRQTAERRALADQVLAGDLRIDAVNASPDNDECFFCPFYRPQSAKDSGPGCPGTAAASTPNG
ncbi:hypothetical protein [Aeromicrobium marinum]|uniref:hypothetical protein n=1 Tax=Aeromicrobium marinum TaxID=219314 RepID=UPI0001BCC8C7|nr:hypothetical protein [Aeromicrobium marinum]